MRTVTLPLLAILGLCGASTARAADLDYDYLRGADYDPAPASVLDWSGVYVGGHGGYTSGGLAQRDALQSTLAQALSVGGFANASIDANPLFLPRTHTRGASFGLFAGYNVQFDDIVFGIEADYTHTDQNSWASSSINRTLTTNMGASQAVILSGTTNTRIDDYGTVRGRAGYAFGNMLSYVTGGVAIGQATMNDIAGAQSIPYGPTMLVPNAKTKTIGGVALGFGLEYAITPNILLRGEYQYVLFQSFNGHRAELNTIRGGAALKF